MPAQGEIAIGRNGAVAQHDGFLRVRGTVDSNGVVGAFNAADHIAGVEMNGHGHRVDCGAVSRIEHWRFDAVAVGNRIAQHHQFVAFA